MKLIVSTVRGALKDRRGITALEYGLIAAMITVVLIVALTQIAPTLTNGLNNLVNAVKNI